MTEWRLKKLMKEKTEKDASMYSLSEKQKQHKISIIENEELKIQEYLSSGCCNVKLVKLIFKSKSQTKRKWKYADNLCTGCKLMEETGQEILGGGTITHEGAVPPPIKTCPPPSKKLSVPPHG